MLVLQRVDDFAVATLAGVFVHLVDEKVAEAGETAPGPDSERFHDDGWSTGFGMPMVGAAAVLVASAGYELETAISVAFSVTANVGPALGGVGPGADFSGFPGYVKIGLSFCMLAGRLDVFTLFVLLQPKFWRA